MTALVMCTSPVPAVNSIVAESKTFLAGNTACTVGVYITNDIPVVGMVLTLEMRSLTGGAYIGGVINNSTFKWGPVPGGRVDSSPLGPAGPNWPDAIIFTQNYSTPSPPCQHPRGVTTTSYQVPTALPDAVSPDGFLHAGISIGDPGIGEEAELVPGSDPPGQPSFRFVFPLNMNPGTFIIDSCCVTPGNVCEFDDINVNIYYPAVTPGLITVLACGCDCHGDPICDGARSDLRDVVTTIDVALRGEVSVPDPSPGCDRRREDVNCSGGIDIIDVVHVIAVAFGGADPATEYCDPCE